MSDPLLQIRRIRIDIPARESYVYLFISPAEVEKWDPWWRSLYEYLLSLAPAEPNWKYEPVQHVFAVRPTLTDEQRSALAAFLQTAPSREVDTHRTLRRAIELSPACATKLQLMYFAAAPG